MRILGVEDIPPLIDLPLAVLEEMHAAGLRLLECEHALTEAGSNVVAEILRLTEEFYQWDHYPKGDVYCADSHAQYYYHAHPPTERGNEWGDEHGHFHTFLRPQGFPSGIKTAAGDNEAPAHLVAVSMNYEGRASRLFTTNRWVTGEIWYDAGTVSRFLEHFHIGHENPSRLANDWISSLLVLFRPAIQTLLHARDEMIAAHTPTTDDLHVYDDRNLEVASILDIDVQGQIGAVEAALDTAGAG
jgi:hypothetical protein